MRKCGLSTPKLKALRALAHEIAREGLDLAALAALEAAEAHARLTKVHGVGPWTADIFLLFCLGHSDAFPAGDLALQEAARLALGLQKAARREAADENRRTLAALSRRGGANALGLLPRRQAAGGRHAPGGLNSATRCLRLLEGSA